MSDKMYKYVFLKLKGICSHLLNICMSFNFCIVFICHIFFVDVFICPLILNDIYMPG